jgi:double-stranded uracil-DNA glycosylase
LTARHASFAPFTDAATRVLILGSLPGAVSLAAQRYYAHPQNAFWRLVGAAIDVDLAAMDYPVRVDALRSAAIGLWDVIGSATRRGSLDTELRDIATNDLAGLVATLPALRLVAFNGATAARIGRRQLAGADLAMIDLPSSSPAYTLAFAAKSAAWAAIGAAVRG